LFWYGLTPVLLNQSSRGFYLKIDCPDCNNSGLFSYNYYNQNSHTMNDIKVILKRQLKIRKLGLTFPSKVELDATLDKNDKLFVRHPSLPDIVQEVENDNIKWCSLDDEEERLAEEEEHINRKINLFDF